MFASRSNSQTAGFLVAVRGAAALVQLAFTLALTRHLGPSAVGRFYVYSGWVSLLSFSMSFGLPTLILRDFSKKLLHASGVTSGVLRLSTAATVGVGGLFAVGIISLARPISTAVYHDVGLAAIIRLAAISAIGLAVSKLHTQAVKAFRQPVAATIVETALVPAITLTLLGAFLRGNEGARLGPDAVAEMHVAATYAAALVALCAWMVVRRLADEIRDAGTHAIVAHPKASRSIQAPLIAFQHLARNSGSLRRFYVQGLSDMAFSALPTILLPAFASTAAVGLFNVGLKLVTLADTLLVSLNSMFAPQFSSRSDLHDFAALRQSRTQSTLFAIAVFAPFYALFLAFGRQVLGVFGPGFSDGYILLAVLATGQMVNALTGLSASYNNMTGNELAQTRIMLFSTVALVLLCVAGGAVQGPVGLAVGVALALGGKSLLEWHVASRSAREVVG